ncbi:TPR-like protein [Meredithblackwellia eburnea MCA 4105]
MASSTKKAAYQILNFLQESLSNGSIKEDDKEGIEVAAQCISEAFGVDLLNPSDVSAYSIHPETLTSILDKVPASASASSASKSKAPATAEDKAKADKAKAAGNAAMAKKDYEGAVKSYGEAIDLDDQNPVYWSNRAAAHSQLQSHSSAVSDARQAITLDPDFSKAYSRLGHALYSSGDYKGAVDAYEEGLKKDPGNATMKSSLATAKSRLPTTSAEDDDDDEEEESSSAAATTRGAGGAGAGAGGFPNFGAGGMPDLAGLMSNPAIMQMAQQMMANGGLEQMMNNPMIRQMMGGAGGAGGMPDINALMQDPTMRAMAERMGAGLGRGNGGNNNDNSGGSGSSGSMYS